MEESERNSEFCRIIKNPFDSLKFNWTIQDYEVHILNDCISPEIEHRGAKFKVIRLLKNYQEFNKGFFDYIGILSNSPISVSGDVTVNGKKHAILTTKLKPGENTGLIEYPTLFNVPVVELNFDLRVYGLEMEECLFTKQQSETDKIDADRCRRNLQDDLQTLWQSPRFSDVLIQVGKDSIPAHKNILSARSPVFYHLFKTSDENVDVTQTAQKYQAGIQEECRLGADVSFDIMWILIGFLYGRFPNMADLSEDDLIQLYYASDKYQVLDLRDTCGRTLVDRMSAENVCRLISLFDSRNDLESLSRVADFCCAHWNDLVRLEGWDEVMKENDKFCTLVLEKMTEMC